MRGDGATRTQRPSSTLNALWAVNATACSSLNPGAMKCSGPFAAPAADGGGGVRHAGKGKERELFHDAVRRQIIRGKIFRPKATGCHESAGGTGSTRSTQA